MIAAMDVFYSEQTARVGALLALSWADPAPSFEWVTTVTAVVDYEPGAFFRRELPCLLQALDELDDDTRSSLTTVIVDGYVWLDGDGREGLGAHLFHALAERAAVVGVAKNEFAGNTAAVELLRGESRRPLFVTAAGMDVEEAVQCVARMDGAYRIPTLLQRADALSRT